MIRGVVPSAGASRRMGRPKATLILHGQTFVQSVVGALRDGGCDEVVVVTSGDPEVREAANDTGARVLVNPDPGDGPITSLRLALADIDDGCEGIVYLPVDHPLVKPETVEKVITAGREGIDLALPVFGGERGHPAYFGRRLFSEFLEPDLAEGAKTVVHRHLGEASLVTVTDPGVRADLDTPERYAAALRRTAT